MFKLLILQSFTPVYAVFTHCCRVPIHCCRVPTICIPAPPDLLYSHFLAVRSRLALPSFTMFFLSHYLPRICNLIASQFFAASDTYVNV